jgi:DNA polymerase-4
VSRIWGVGKVTNQRFVELGVRTIGQLRQLGMQQLHEHFGNSAEHFWRLARGIDDRRVVADREAKSISHETTFAADIDNRDVLRAWLMELTEQVAARMRRHHLTARTVHLKVRYSNFDTVTRARRLRTPTTATRTLWQCAAELLEHHLPKRRLEVRLLGMGVSGLQSPSVSQRPLFDDPETDRDNRIDAAADQIRARFGSASIRRASVVQHDVEHRPLPRPEPLSDSHQPDSDAPP